MSKSPLLIASRICSVTLSMSVLRAATEREKTSIIREEPDQTNWPDEEPEQISWPD